MFWITLKLMFFVFVHHTRAQADPCVNATVKRNEHRRSSNYEVGMEGEGSEEYLCDYGLEEGWYIFEGHQGHAMPMIPPGLQKCGTQYPIWLNGDLPTEEQGTVQREACLQDDSSYCQKAYTIQIRNCGDNYAYKLVPTEQICPVAYCIGDNIPCPSEESSETGFYPGCMHEGFPTLSNDPTISFRVGEYEASSDVIMREVVMQCNIEHDETNVYLDVVWFIGDVKVAEHIRNNSIAYNNMPAELFEHEWSGKATLDDMVTCELRARYDMDQIPSPVRSAQYYMGFIVDDLILTVVEGGDPALYTVRPTIPVLCPVGFETCTLNLEVIEPNVDGEVATCPNGRTLKQTAIKFQRTQCIIEIPMVLNPDDNTAFSLEVHAATDDVYDGEHTMILVVRGPEIHQMHDIWSNYHLPQAQVKVIDQDQDIAGLYCRVYNDPHFISMDGRKYDNQMSGEFVLYRHKTLPVEIQAYFNARDGYSGVCGAAVRSGGDLFIYDTCREDKATRIRLYECEDLNLAIEIHGNTIEIELPHGAKITITHNDITIYPSLGDLNNIEGLCGQFDRVCGNDFLGSNGHLFLDSCANPNCSNVKNCPRERQHEFAKTWRVDPDESLYQGKINTVRPNPDTIYCSCIDKEDGNDPKTVCQQDPNLQFCTAGGTGGGGDFEKQCVDRFRMMASNVGSDDVVDEVGPFEYDPNFDPPEPDWKNGWTKELAQAKCEQFIAAVQGFDKCLTIPNVNVDEAISTCIEDIKITGNTDYNVVHANGLLTACLTEITKNMSYFSFNNETGAVEPPNDLIKDICPHQCLNNGSCINQTCQCTERYFGEDCSYDENKVPSLYSIPSGGLCDVRTRPCQQTPVTGYYFLNKETLSCHIEAFAVTVTEETHSLGEVKEKATFDHYERVICPLPRMSYNDNEEMVAIGYILSVSNDGITRSDTRNLIRYDSLCMNCTADFKCVQLIDTCFIQSNCYTKGYIAPEDPCHFCDPDLSNNDWTTDDICQPNNAGLIIGSTVLIVAVAAIASIASVIFIKKKKHNVVHIEMEYEDPTADIE